MSTRTRTSVLPLPPPTSCESPTKEEIKTEIKTLILYPPHSRLLVLQYESCEISIAPIILADGRDTNEWLVSWSVMLQEPHDRSTGTVSLTKKMLKQAFGSWDTRVMPGKFARFQSFVHIPFNAQGCACVKITEEVQAAIRHLLAADSSEQYEGSAPGEM